MNQRQLVVQYVLRNGPCTEVDIFGEVRDSRGLRFAAGSKVRRWLAQGAPAGMVACEQKTGKDYTFVYAESPPDGFEPIIIKGRRSGGG